MDPHLIRWFAAVAATTVGALSVLVGGFRILLHVLRNRPALVLLSRRARWPARILAVCLAVWTLVPAAPVSGPVRSTLAHGLALVFIATGVWLAVEVSFVIEDAALNRYRQAPVDDIRAELLGILRASPRWNGEVWTLQVTDVTERTIQVRALMSADDAGTAFDLRCEVRERLIAWLQEKHPESLPRIRTDIRRELVEARPSTSG